MTSLLSLLEKELPIHSQLIQVSRKAGLIIIDEVNGFATVGCGPLAPRTENPQVTTMIKETDRLARTFVQHSMPILVFLDTHDEATPEDPYPLHCLKGSGDEELVAALKWLEGCSQATLMQKNCINGFVGGIDLESGRNRVINWITSHHLDQLILVGICTDICVMDFALTMLSARNHGMTPTLKDIVIFTRALATYHMSHEEAARLNLSKTAIHPQDLTHHLGQYFMQQRGALLADRLGWEAFS